ncbi:hypothetical protein RJ639_008415 [Escallonia herrerae]|uniref:Receptor-like serine/threonine-protein kinase n=1 Tax=Escallonia herrerae TaxID=1293975 RepID=A0AA88VTB6_9ASTE|nr:hypothetical protein RJ639_008415 [Escallonia herrerae]
MLGKNRLFFHVPFLLCASLGFFCFRVVISQIPLGSRLSVEENNYWVSSNGDFAIGFFNRSNQYSVGVRFSSRSIPVSKQKVVWVAGADLTVGDKSYFQLMKSGELVLFDSSWGVIAWDSNTTNSSVASAILRDDGNLVLLKGNKDIVWQSFDNPSDTLLPGQNFSASQMLRAASRNSVSSYYSLYMDALGQLQLKWESSVIYWTSGNTSESRVRATLRSDGTIHLLDRNSRSVWSVLGGDHHDPDVKFRILRLDVDGNLRLYSWVQSSTSWISVWQALSNQCSVFATCGLCGICLFNVSGSPVCKCPFTPMSESNSKCLVPYRQDCKSGSSMDMYEHTLVYGIYPPNETIVRSSLERCKRLCQEDPLCTAATFTNDGTAECRITKTRYISGQSDPSLGSISLVKRCSDPIAVLPVLPKSPLSSPPYTAEEGSRKLCVPCLVGVAVGTFITFFVIQLGIGLYFYRKRITLRKNAALTHAGPKADVFIMLSFAELESITENFKHQLGPNMYKGTLPNNRPVAVKALNAAIEERKFRCAVSKVRSVSHKNLVKLEGYCCESGHRYLVYEFARNGSLRKCLDDAKMCKRLTWRKRMDACLAVARAVSYLHAGCREFVNHGNLKCENVVLDDDLEAKVGEFGLGTVISELSKSGGSAGKDVQDFGKMVVALVSGRHTTKDALKWAYQKWAGAQATEVVDKRIQCGVDLDELERAMRIAFWCLQFNERMRPSMGEVVKVLEGALAVDPSPPPFALETPPGEEEESLGSDPEP